jgi:hypothetical protein
VSRNRAVLLNSMGSLTSLDQILASLSDGTFATTSVKP